MENKIAQERKLNEIYAQRLQMMKEMAMLKQKIGINDIALNVTAVPESSSSERRNNIQNNVNNNNNNSSSCCDCDCDCDLLDCKNIFKGIAVVITSIILSIVCFIVNMATLAYLVSIGWFCILIRFMESDDTKCFIITPHLYFLHPWKWICEIINEIKKM